MPGSSRFPARLPTLALVLLLAAACELEWGGAEIGVETPERPGGPDTLQPTPTDTDLPPLPEGPLLHAVRVDPNGRALAVPAARMTVDGPGALDPPADVPAAWWERFADRFQSPGTELPLYATGRRVGTLVLRESRRPTSESCPSAVEGRALLPPGSPAPELAFAWTPAAGAKAPPPEAPAPAQTSQRLRTFAPILAERILQDEGVERHFLARPARLAPVAFADDSVPGLAATYLIADTLAPVPPDPGTSTSLFFLARYDRSEGYVPVWSRTATYRDTASKEVLSHLDWLPADPGRVEMLLRTDARSTRLAAARTGAEGASGELDWTASERCPVVDVLGIAGPSGSPGEGTVGDPGDLEPGG